MGSCLSRNSITHACEEDPILFTQKMVLLQQKINAILKQREEDNEAFEREMLVFALKEAEWRKEKKKLKDEVKRLRKRSEERMKRTTTTTESESYCSSSCGGSGSNGSMMLIEQMREEKARRDDTVEKWKMLYLAIKTELDELIQRTHDQGLYCRADENEMIEELQHELNAKDEIIEILKAQISSMKEQDNKRKREVDILRQSMKILSNKKGISPSTFLVESPPTPTGIQSQYSYKA